MPILKDQFDRSSKLKGVLAGGPGKTTQAPPEVSCRPYRMRFAECQQDREAVFRLRFLVFNLELNEGLESAYKDGLDRDAFDDVCDHLLVEHRGRIVGTYRLLTGRVAAANLGFYSAREFDFAPYERLRDSMVELGRACVHREHRSFEVLTLLWRGIACYAVDRGARYLIGCSSLNSESVLEASDIYSSLQQFLAPPDLRTSPRDDFKIPVEPGLPFPVRVNPPPLLRAYLSIGAQICGEPALDREFKTIDFLTLLDLENLASPVRARFMGRSGS